ncbi:unnamed protein product [Psylliodes chrysocephalus]|uniref:Uncharacterized protein n=1 Tax=Psylliodes chrysocephalus TaxID=3402493 RepID=A0A9P0CPF4_9CUCU|nr:unnamed protein product [Psylliodes chrysocephala]
MQRLGIIIYKPTIGGHSKHSESNRNGKKLIEFATEKDLRIATTYFQHAEIYKGTWISPDRKTCNQIDHIAIESKHLKYILDARSYRGADIDTDHILVRAKLKYRKPPKERKRLVGGIQDSLNRWAEYFNEVFEIEENDVPEMYVENNLGINNQDEPISIDEIKEIIRMVKNNKAPGEMI